MDFPNTDGCEQNVSDDDYNNAATHGYVSDVDTSDWRHTKITFDGGRTAILKGNELGIRPGHIVSVYGYLGEDGVFYAQHHLNSWYSSMSGFAYNPAKAWNAVGIGVIFGQALAKHMDAPPVFPLAVAAAVAFSVRDYLRQRKKYDLVRERLRLEITET